MSENKLMFDQVYSRICSSLSKSDEGIKLLKNLNEAIGNYVNHVSLSVAKGEQPAPEVYSGLAFAYTSAKAHMTFKFEDVSGLVEDKDFIEGLAGRVVAHIMDKRKR